MPRTPRRRAHARRRLPPAPTFPGAPPDVSGSEPARPVHERVATSREASLLAGELKRVALVSAACAAILAALTVADRLA